MNLDDKIIDTCFEPSGFLKFTGFDEAAIGVAIGAHFEERLAYDEDHLLELIEEQNETDLEGAKDYLSFNMLNGFHGYPTPIVIRRFE